MKKIGYKLLVAFVFSSFVLLTKMLFSKSENPLAEEVFSKDFWVSFSIFYAVGYVLLGNILWASKQKKR